MRNVRVSCSRAWWAAMSLMVAVSLLVPAKAMAGTYDKSQTLLPQALELRLALKTRAPADQFFSRVIFVNQAGQMKAVRIYFTFVQSTATYPTRHIYSGSAPDIAGVQELVAPNNRSYWDDMRFERDVVISNNNNNPYSLDVSRLEMWIHYDFPPAWNKFDHIKIASETDPVPQPATAYFLLDNRRGRIEHVLERMGWTMAQYDALPDLMKNAIGDLGKSGTSDAADWPDPGYENPKYGYDVDIGHMCGEFVSWYYYEAGYTLNATQPTEDGDYVYNFLRPTYENPSQIDYWYDDAGLKYNYDAATGNFYQGGLDGGVDLTTPPIDPKAGDYFGLFLQHATLLLQWDRVNRTAYFIDGVAPISISAFDVDGWLAAEPAKYPFIGRYTPNNFPLCSESNATDMGAPGNAVTVRNDGCIMVRNAYPSWWATRNMQLQSMSGGVYPVPYSWTNTCASGSGTGTITSSWQSVVFGPTSGACATLIDLHGDGSGTLSLTYYAN